MNWEVVIPILVIILALNLQKFVRIPMLAWVTIWWGAIYITLQFGFAAPLPHSIIREFMIITTLSLFVYVVSDRQRLQSVKDPIVSFITQKKYHKRLICVLIVFPLFVAVRVYLKSQVEILPPGFSRSVHPAPPDSITFKGEKIDLIRGENPFRQYQKSDKEKFKEHVAKGKKVYYQNCFYCHGDAMQGNGLYAHALDPIPTDFQDPATIGMLQENFLFWRIAKGGIGLPTEGAPWASAMPAWEDFLEEEDIWNVILFLYDYTGNKPRALEHHE